MVLLEEEERKEAEPGRITRGHHTSTISKLQRP